MPKITGIGLSAGRAERLQPLSLMSDNYARSKGTVHLLGTRPLSVTVKNLVKQGVEDIAMITLGRENRYQTKRILGYGENYGARIKYSPVDYKDTGSADAVMTILDYFDIGGTVIVFPNDGLYGLNLEEAQKQHEKNNAALTILTTGIKATSDSFDSRGEFRYGIVNRNKIGKIEGFTEKPKPEELIERYNLRGMQDLAHISPIVNSGAYIINSEIIKKIGKEELAEQRKTRLDFGKDLLPWLVQNSYNVFSYDLDNWGDFGDIPSFIDTTVRGLNKEFDCLGELGTVYDSSKNLWIEPESLYLKDKYGKTLEEKIKDGSIQLKNVRIGKYVEIDTCSNITNSNIDDDCIIKESVRINKSSLGEGTIIGPYSKLSETATGLMVEVESDIDDPTVCESMVAIGDEATIGKGSLLSNNARVWPKLTIPQDYELRAKSIKTQEEI